MIKRLFDIVLALVLIVVFLPQIFNVLKGDMKILWMTFLKVVKRSDISSDSSVTMEKFEGSK